MNGYHFLSERIDSSNLRFLKKPRQGTFFIFSRVTGWIKKIVSMKSGLIGKTLAKSHLREKGAVVLGIEREKTWIRVPKANEIIKRGDRLVVYGPLSALKEILKQ